MACSALTRYPDEARYPGGPISTESPPPRSRRWSGGRPRSSMCAARSPGISSWSGVPMAKGDKVTMWYCSANRDEDKFGHRRGSTFAVYPSCRSDSRRRGVLLPRRQSSPARDQCGVRRVAASDTRCGRPTAEPARLQSSFIHGIKRLPIRWHAARLTRRDAANLTSGTSAARRVVPDRGADGHRRVGLCRATATLRGVGDARLIRAEVHVNVGVARQFCAPARSARGGQADLARRGYRLAGAGRRDERGRHHLCARD